MDEQSDKLKRLQEKITSFVKNSDEQHEQFKNAKSKIELSLALDAIEKIDPKKTDVVAKALDLVNDKKEDTALRSKALSKLTTHLHDSESSVKSVIKLMTDRDTPTDLRKTALDSLLKISFTSQVLEAQMPAFKLALKQLVKEKNPELLLPALETLAIRKDEEIQNLLLNGLKNEDKAIVVPEKAIQLLSYDIRADHYPLLRDVLKKTKDPKVMVEAINVLAADPESREIILKFFTDKNTNTQVRLRALIAVHAGNQKQFISLAKDSVLNDQEDNSIRTASLNLLSLPSSIKSLGDDKKFTDKVESLKSGNDSDDLKKVATRFLNNRNNLTR